MKLHDPHLNMEYPPASIVAVSIILPLLALLAVFLRFYVRLRLQPSHIGIDDWLIVGAVILALADGANLAAGMFCEESVHLSEAS